MGCMVSPSHHDHTLTGYGRPLELFYTISPSPIFRRFSSLHPLLCGLHAGHSTCMHAVPSTGNLVYNSNIAILHTERKSEIAEMRIVCMEVRGYKSSRGYRAYEMNESNPQKIRGTTKLAVSSKKIQERKLEWYTQVMRLREERWREGNVDGSI